MIDNDHAVQYLIEFLNSLEPRWMDAAIERDAQNRCSYHTPEIPRHTKVMQCHKTKCEKSDASCHRGLSFD
jgi:hypothetical protein